MHQNQPIQQQQIVTEALKHLSTLTGSRNPTQLELYVQNLAHSENDFEGLMLAVENQKLEENQLKLLCMLISKVLQSGHLQEIVELKTFMRLTLNWSLPSSCKKMWEIELKKFIKTISSEHLSYIFRLVEQMQQLITSIQKEGIKKRYESSPFQMDGMQLTICINFPGEFVPMVQTYLLFIEIVLYRNEGLYFVQTLTQKFFFFRTLHMLIFDTKNIISHPCLFGSLFQFWGELLQLYSNLSKLKEFFQIVQNLECMTAHINLIYKALCHPDNDGIDYMRMDDHANAAGIVKLKAQVCEFHTSLLSQIKNCKRKSVLLTDLSSFLPSLIKTAQKYLTNKSFEHAYEEDFIKNILPLLSITVEESPINKEALLSILVNLAIPFLQMGIQQTDQNDIVGEDLHAILDDCCELQSAGDLLSVGAQLLEKIFSKNNQVLDQFYQIVRYSIRKRFAQTEEQSTLNIPTNALSLKAVFLGLSLSAYHDDQKYETICAELTDLVNKQFLYLLSESEFQFFFHFMNFSWFLFYERDRSKLQRLIEYALSPSCFKRPSLQYFALQFLKCIFNELSTTQWLLKFITTMPMYRSAQSIGIKWDIFHGVVIKNIEDFDTSKIVWIVQRMRGGASRELERMENQKRKRHLMEYGEVKQYLSSLGKLQLKLGRNFMRRQIVHSLLDFSALVDRASPLSLHKELLKIAINIFPLCCNNPQLIGKGLKVLQKVLVTFVQHNYRGNECLLAIFSGINTFKDDENSLASTLLRVLQFGSLFVANNQSTLQDNILQRSLLCLLCLFQKYLISFPILDQHKTTLSSTFQRITAVCETTLEQHTQNLHLLAAKYYLTTTIFNLLIDAPIDWQQLRTGAIQGWFQKYDAFVLLHTFALILPKLYIEAKRVVLQIGLLLLCCQELNLKQSRQYMSKKREPLEEIHNTVDCVIYEKNMAEQVWVMFESCGINSWDTCISLFSTFSPQAFDYLMFCKYTPNYRTQQEQQLHYCRIKLAKAKEAQNKLKMPTINTHNGNISERKIIRVTGEKVDSIYFCDQKTTFKRNINKHFIDHNQPINQDYSDESQIDSNQEDAEEEQSRIPCKKLIDNYFIEHRTVRTMLNLHSTQTISKKEERYGNGGREKVQRMLLAADMKHLRTSQDQ